MTFVIAESLAEQIASHLTGRIIQGEMVDNERIQEARIVKELEVSRGSVREALLILERRHLVTILPRRGAFVTELTEDRVRGLYRLYGNLLEMLAERLSWSCSEEDRQVLVDRINHLRNTAASHDQLLFAEANFELINTAARAANNEYLSAAIGNLQPVMHRALALVLRTRLSEMEETTHTLTSLIDLALKDSMEGVSEQINLYCKRHCSLVIEAIGNHAPEAAPESL